MNIDLNSEKTKFLVQGHELAFFSIMYSINEKQIMNIHNVGNGGDISKLHRKTIKQYATDEDLKKRELAKNFFVLELSPSDETIDFIKGFLSDNRQLGIWHQNNIDRFKFDLKGEVNE